MAVRFDADWTYRGFRALMLENERLRVVVLPELGGKIWSIVHKPRDRELLWHNPRLPPRAAPFGASYDDWFCGGWDELFPNDALVAIGGETYPDHGEVWSMAAEWEVVARSADEVAVRLTNRGVVTPTTFAKTVVLRAGESCLRVRYAIGNDGAAPLDFLWKLHPAVALGTGPRLDLPPCRVLVDPEFAEEFGEREFAWPLAPAAGGGEIDLRVVPSAASGAVRFFYTTDLDAGWCALTQTDERIGFGLAFDPAVLGSVWIFGAHGGWRGFHTAILEPCTGYPYKLDDAIRQGTCGRLDGGEGLETEVVAVVYDGFNRVTHVGRDGSVEGSASERC